MLSIDDKVFPIISSINAKAADIDADVCTAIATLEQFRSDALA
ncbi:MAG: hypothetical protein ACFB5Z_03080 [Elainellaceae cyanobacterium]